MAVQELVDHNTAVVVVENDPEAEWLATPHEMRIWPTRASAKSVITTLPDDAQNLMVLAAREMAPNIASSAGLHVQRR